MFEENYELLATQIIHRAKLDIKSVKLLNDRLLEKERIEDREEAKWFFYSEWFKELCEFTGEDCNAIIKKHKKYIDFDDIVEKTECVNER